jgi:putative membrane protein
MVFIKNMFLSIFIGVGSIAPGVSGGALAIVLGLYEKILDAINNLLKDIKKHGTFLLSIGIGVALGIIIFSSIQLKLIKSFEMQTMFTFAGLVVGTVPALLKTANKKGFNNKYIIPFCITLAIGILFSYLNNTSISDNVRSTEIVLNAKNIIFLIVVGFIMAGSLVIPGISGTVLLFLLGVYGLVLNSISSIKDILFLSSIKAMFYALIDKIYILLPLLIGLVVGTIFFSKLMEILLKHFYGITYYAIIGFVIGSIPELIPEIIFNKTFILSLIFFFIALILSLQINRLVK